MVLLWRRGQCACAAAMERAAAGVTEGGEGVNGCEGIAFLSALARGIIGWARQLVRQSGRRGGAHVPFAFVHGAYIKITIMRKEVLGSRAGSIDLTRPARTTFTEARAGRRWGLAKTSCF